MSLKVELVLRAAFPLIIGIGAGAGVILSWHHAWNLPWFVFTVTEYVLGLIVSGWQLLLEICFTETSIKQTSSRVSSPEDVYQYDIFGEFEKSEAIGPTDGPNVSLFAEQIFSLKTAIHVIIILCGVAMTLWIISEILSSHNREGTPARPDEYDQRLSIRPQRLHSSQSRMSRLQADSNRARERSCKPSARQIRNAASKKHTASDLELLIAQLFQANEDLSQEREKSQCIVCMDANREVLLKPCNHYCMCSDCSKGFRECPVCQKKLRKAEKIFHV